MKLFVVLGEAHKRAELRDELTLKFGEILFDKGTGNLPSPVRTVIHKDHRVAIGDGRGLFAGRDDGGGLDEFVALAARIGHFQGAEGVGGAVAFALGEQVIGGLDARPAVIAVHGEVTPYDGGDASSAQLGKRILHRLQGSGCALGWRVAAIEEGMYVDPLGSALHSEFGHGLDMLLVAVDTARRQQTENVHRPVIGDGLIHGLSQRVVAKERPALDGLADAGEFLVYHSSCA